METTEPKLKRIIKIPRRKLFVFVILIIILAVFFLFYNNYRRNYDDFVIMEGDRSLPGELISLMSSTDSMQKIAPFFRRDYGQQPDITDTREFLKVNYSAGIKTRDVSDVFRDVKGAIRDVEGRIDSMNETEKQAYISFVIPKSKFDSFRDEVESITHEKLYTESVSSQNLLGQKQNLEQQREEQNNSLAELENQKKNLISSHAQKVSSLNKELAAIQEQLEIVRQAKVNTQNQDELFNLQNQENILLQQEANIKQRQASENNSYTSQLQSLNGQIKQYNDNLKNLNKQDEQFENNIETVSGYITIRWVSLWAMAKIFSPIHPTIIVIVIALLLVFYFNRKGFIPKIEIV